MSTFDFNAGVQFREEGDLAEAIRCLKSALEQDRDFIEAYVELGRTYLVAFHESGDPLCIDSARKVCMAGLRRDASDDERNELLAMQDRIENLLLESQKAEMDAMSAAMDTVPQGPALLPDDETVARTLDTVTDLMDASGGDGEDDLGH